LDSNASRINLSAVLCRGKIGFWIHQRARLSRILLLPQEGRRARPRSTRTASAMEDAHYNGGDEPPTMTIANGRCEIRCHVRGRRLAVTRRGAAVRVLTSTVSSSHSTVTDLSRPKIELLCPLNWCIGQAQWRILARSGGTSERLLSRRRYPVSQEDR
jgi:hypothetical protein